MTTKEKVRVLMDYGISQYKIAKIAGISRSTLQMWMSGERENLNDGAQVALEVALTSIADGINKAVYGESNSPFEAMYDDINLDD